MRPASAITRVTCAALTLALALGAPAMALSIDPAPDAQPPAGSSERVMVIYRDGVSGSLAVSALAQAGIDPAATDLPRPNVAVVDVPTGGDPHVLAKRLGRQPGVVAAARVVAVRAAEDVPPNDSRYAFEQGAAPADGQQAYLGPDETYPYSIDLEPVWDSIFNTDRYAAEPGRAGVPIAVIDTGCSAPFMEDTGRIVPVWNYIADNTDTRDDFVPRHGTRVTGLIGAQADNAYATAGALHATKSPLLIYKVLDGTGSGTSDDTMMAMMDAADDGAKIINASLGEPAVMDWPTSPYDATYDLSPDDDLRAAWQATVDYCTSKGTIVVSATGNYADDRWYHGDTYSDVLYPAACTGTLAVGSIDPTDGIRSSYSSYGPEISLVAPGERVWTTPSTGVASTTYFGTSFSAPLVSGSLATLWSLVPELPAQDLKGYVTESADSDIAWPGFDIETGYGLFDARATYEAMIAEIATQSVPATLTASAPLGFETALTWTPADGTGVHYRYGCVGGPSYLTTATTGRLALPSDGDHTVYVRAYANDRFDTLEATTTVVTATTGMPALSSARIDGNDRYETAAAISASAFPGTAPALVIASGQNWPDGLAASVLARTVGGPLLLTRTTSLPVSARDEILRLNPSRIYLVGGTNAISRTTEETIRSLQGMSYTMERIGGIDRYETAALIARKVQALGGASDGTAVIASGQNYPDALAGAPVAAEAGWPILLAKSGSIPAATSGALSALGVDATLVLGGTRVLGDAVTAALPSPTRVFGSDRYATSRAIADYAMPAQFDGSSLGFTTGRAFPDALAAGPLLAADGTPLVLADGMTPALEAWLGDHDGDTTALTLFGGSFAMPYDLEFDIKAALRQP